MKFKLDENVPVELVEDLRSYGHQADTVFDENLCGAPDSSVLGAARAEGRILFTLDRGIANPNRCPSELHAGVVLFRPDRPGKGAVTAFVRERLAEVLSAPLEGRLIVVGPTRIRCR